MDRNSWAARARVAQYVALRKESVDRNVIPARHVAAAVASLSARRAWIEIAGRGLGQRPRLGRSPQGERG